MIQQKMCKSLEDNHSPPTSPQSIYKPSVNLEDAVKWPMDLPGKLDFRKMEVFEGELIYKVNFAPPNPPPLFRDSKVPGAWSVVPFTLDRATLCMQLLLQFYINLFEVLLMLLSWSENVNVFFLILRVTFPKSHKLVHMYINFASMRQEFFSLKKKKEFLKIRI